MLAIAITAGGMISAFSMFNALILSYSRVPIAMVEDGFLPRIMGLRMPGNGAPWVAILICAGLWAVACVWLKFDSLLLLDALLYGLSLILEFAALVVLRIREPSLPRPYKVPGGLIGCVLIGVGPILILCLAFSKGIFDETAHLEMVFSAVAVVAGIVLFGVTIWINPRAGRPVTESRGFEVLMNDSRPKGSK